MDHFLTLADLTSDDLRGLLDLAIELKKEWRWGGNRPLLQGKTLGMVFQKPSLRTRVSFEMGMLHLGGNSLYLSPFEIKLGERESVPDVARVLSRYVDIIMIRTTSHDRMLELAGRAWGRITPGETLSILRDRRLPGGFFPGNGHRGTLNALIATHSVVMDLTDGVFWAATPPHQLGPFLAFRFEDFERRPRHMEFEADPMAGDGEFSRLELSRQYLELGLNLLEEFPQTAVIEDMKSLSRYLLEGYYKKLSPDFSVIPPLDLSPELYDTPPIV